MLKKNRIFKLVFAICLGAVPIFNASAQTESLSLDAGYNNLSWNDFIRKTEAQHNVRFYYGADTLPDFKVSLPKEKMPFPDLLNEILRPYHFMAAIDKAGNIFITRNSRIFTTLPDNFFIRQSLKETRNGNQERNGGTLKDRYLATDNTFDNKYTTIGEITNDNRANASISGYVKNQNDNTPAIGVLMRIEETGAAVMTDASGFYALSTKKGNCTLIAGNLETKEKRIRLKVLSDGRLDLILEPKLVTLDEVVISAEKEHIVKSTQMGFQRLVAKDVKEIPLVLGESDIVKVSLLLPGVQSVGEGSAGLNVRGSPTDENLFIINNIPVYNSSHVLGFFSAFNSDAIKDFTLYKSNIPAGYGGRLSSIFDIRTKQGNQNNFTASGGISPVTARLIVEGPISRRNSSYMVGLRSSYSDWILKQVDDPNISNSSAKFADAVIDLSFELNKNNRLRVSSYHSYDKINLIDQNKYHYVNNGAALVWNRLFREKHSLLVSLIYSQYDFDEENSEVQISSYKDYFKLKHAEVRAGLTIRPNAKHTLTAGLNSIFYQIDQGVFEPLNDNSLVATLDLGNEQALESGIFLTDDWTLSPKLSVSAGIRYNSYLYLGPQQVRIYSDGPKSPESIVDTAVYASNEIAKNYGAPDLRLAARYVIKDNFSVKMSFSQLRQYLFMLSNTIAIAPTDKWKLSDNNIKPMSGNQYSLGLYNSILGGKLDLSVEAYYKTVKNLVEYKDGANLSVNVTPEAEILQGDLRSYGIEFMISKPKGRFNGWLNYTYSRAIVTIDSPEPEARINNGESYPSNYDKPHALNIVANYKFSRRISVSSNIVYSTGHPITYPVGFFYQDNIKVPLYSKRNEYRIPDYFRMDFSVKLEGNLAARKFAHGTWIFSVYNLTGRKNAYSVYFKNVDELLQGYKLSVFGVPIVSLTYSFKLGNYAN
jgi:hypothetical protein